MNSIVFLIFLPLLLPSTATKPPTFTPSDLYLLDCGSPTPLRLPPNRLFLSEPQSSSFLSTDEDIRLSSTDENIPPLYRTARAFSSPSTYSFPIPRPGPHFLRLHFLPFPSPSLNLSSALFSVSTQDSLLLRRFSLPPSSPPTLKDFLLNLHADRLLLTLSPLPPSFAFLNALELVSAPQTLIPSSAPALLPRQNFSGIDNYALQILRRVNVGGARVAPENDMLAREWAMDSFLVSEEAVERVAVAEGRVRFPEDGTVSEIVAPRSVYATGDGMRDANVSGADFNVTWRVPADGEGYLYLVRLHFCDIVSRRLDVLYFNVFVNGILAIPNLDLSSLTGSNKINSY